jgi:predicted RNase H-like HicB family nuclease
MNDVWTREIIEDEEGLFAARIVELPGCFSEGRSWEEASDNLQKALELWLEAAFESFEDYI